MAGTARGNAAEAYAESQGLVQLLNDVLNEVLEKQPKDAVAGLISALQARQRAEAHADAASSSLGIIIAGAPASGKGTQCELLVQKYGVVHISTGDLLRSAVDKGTEIGVQAKAYMVNGNLVPDALLIDLVLSRLSQDDCVARGWLLDGFPRTRAQGEALEAAGITPSVFLLLEVPTDELIQRVVGRRLDPVTGKIYHVKFSPPPEGDVADRCTVRADDTEEKARTRLALYDQNLGAVRGLYEEVTAVVDGNRPKAAVFADLDAAVEAARAAGDA